VFASEKKDDSSGKKRKNPVDLNIRKKRMIHTEKHNYKSFENDPKLLLHHKYNN
jgi:hypothetical protein